jgi:hypothetical protein
MIRTIGRIAPLAFLCAWMATFPSTTTAEEPRFLGRTRQEWVSALESSGRRERTHAAWAISQFAVDEVGPTNTMLWLNELCLLAESESPTIRYWGVLGIGRLLQKVEPGHPARTTAIAALTTVLKDQSPGPRVAAAEALAVAGQAGEALPVLVLAMSSPQESVRIQAVSSLEKLGPAVQPAVATLEAATSDSSEYVKRIAGRALAKLKGP